MNIGWEANAHPSCPGQARAGSSVSLDLSNAWVLLYGLLTERALPGLLAWVLMDGSAAAVRAALRCRASRSALMPWTSSAAAVMSSLDTCSTPTHQFAAISTGMDLPALSSSAIFAAVNCQHSMQLAITFAKLGSTMG